MVGSRLIALDGDSGCCCGIGGNGMLLKKTGGVGSGGRELTVPDLERLEGDGAGLTFGDT